jgi:predicted HTH domain antitoxin
MKTMSIDYPESILSALSVSAESFESEARAALAVKLYEIGRLSSGQAAALAGMPRIQFLFACKNYGSPSVNWDSEEIAAEMADNV